MTRHDDIEAILRAIDADGAEMDELVRDEHARYQWYLDALSLASPSDERKFIDLVLRDPDQVMAEAAVVNHVDRKASLLPSRQAFAAWAAEIGDLVAQHGFLGRRLREWELLKSIMEGEPGGTEGLSEASDWLQRKVSSEATSQAVLETLAEVGRTKRVRNEARSRARSAGWSGDGSSSGAST